MPSFDTVLEANFVEVKNAIDQVAREIGTRFDFKGTSAAIEFKEKEKEIVLHGDADFQLQQIDDVLRGKLAKRGVDVRFLEAGKVEKAGGDKVRQAIKVKNGVSTEDGKKVQQILKGSKLKVQGAIQGDAVRVSGAKRDDLQAAMALIRSELKDLPLSFNNFRD
ncbi:YajQ family cyclic di-GMP-binding protein [Hydrogenophaga sp.]|uniref:YajQ family cyclic di-GMP-binding protein n=1 Tax=Hydrogenophaga sp. TaxID=1904254 RepID=UPI002631896D|nr:YajQ family cyclic di-GMP-binding protein [Hydrogenophaga sp.]MCW5654398.1 YajQ family cyclic di-GMP-binding protein [Hydrogenophaga sp.]